jgi:hypothetical protein
MVVVPPDVNKKFDCIFEERGFRRSKTRLAVSNGYAGSIYNRGLADGRTVMNGHRLGKSAG